MNTASPNAAPRTPREDSPCDDHDAAGTLSGRLAALGALYQGEKTDAVGIFGVAMTMMGVAAAYLVGVSALADKYGSQGISWTFVLLLPAPLWLITIYHSLITLSAMRHGRSVDIIETELFNQSGLSPTLRDQVGSRAGNKIMDITQAGKAHIVATVFVYGGFFLGVIIYTVYVIVRAWHHVQPYYIGMAIAGYSIALIVTAASWGTGLFPGDEGKESPEQQNDRQKGAQAPEAGPDQWQQAA